MFFELIHFECWRRLTILYTNINITWKIRNTYFFCIHPPPELLPVSRLLEQYMMPTLDAALLYSSRAGSDQGRTLDRFEELY